MRSRKQPAKESAVGETLAELEQAVFGDAPTTELEGGLLTEPEQWWSQHYHWFKDNGYLLRPRYAPDWVPSWKNTKKSWFLCEDGCEALYATTILDGTRISDGEYVAFKLVNGAYHPYEIDIAQYFSSQETAASANHCVPVYEVLPVPDESDKVVIVMPLLYDYLQPAFQTIGEAVECFRQLFEALQFMHQHRVAHRDCSSINIMMDPKGLYIDALHPAIPLMKRDNSGYARYKTRSERPPKYFLIDFGLSRRYDASVTNPMEVPIWGADKSVPEFQKCNAPCDPFPTDVFYIGNTIREEFVHSNLGFEFMRPLIADMVQNDPSKRPTMDEVVERFTAIRATLSTQELRSRVVGIGERGYQRVLCDAFHWMRTFVSIVRGVPPLPTS